MVKKYRCEICGITSDQKGHHTSHLRTNKHKQQVKIKKLEYKEKTGFKRLTKNMNSKEIEKKLNEEIEKLETVIINEETVYCSITNKDINGEVIWEGKKIKNTDSVPEI